MVFVPIIDRYGRLTAVRLSIILALIGGGFQGSAFYMNSYVALLVGRLLFGLQLGIGVMVYSVYLIEIAPETYKSVFGMCFGMFLTFGTVVSMHSVKRVETLTILKNAQFLDGFLGGFLGDFWVRHINWPFLCSLSGSFVNFFF